MQKSLQNNSKIVSVLRFPLTVGVVFIHSVSFTQGQYLVYDFLYTSITKMLCGICVPLFFFFSGYFFFQNVNAFDLATYKSKIKKRVRTLLIPYIFWNLFVVAIIGIGQLLIPSLFSGAFKSVAEFDVNDWLSIFYCSLGSNKPIAFQLWFLRDLIIMSLLTPLFYYLCRYLRFWWLIILMILCVLGAPSLAPGLSFVSLFYYCAGCWFGINRMTFSFKAHKWRWMFILFYVALFVIELFFKMAGYAWVKYIHGLTIIVGCISILQLASLYVEPCDAFKSRFKKSIGNSSFFIYCYHGIFSLFIGKVANNYVNNDSEAVLCYFGIVVILVVLGVVAFNCFSKVLPRFTSIVTGSRN